jgi:photosystem II stability/assembly factor-like uncharacterized protein
MRHTIIYKRDGSYSAFPQLYVLPDGRHVVGIKVSPYHEHFGTAGWVVLASADEGETWEETDDPRIPFNWTGTSVREKEDRFAAIMPDGSYLCAGSVGWQVWPADRRQEAEEKGLEPRPHPVDEDVFVVNADRLYVQRSTDDGRTWTRREWAGARGHSLSRSVRLADGTILIPFSGSDSGGEARMFVWRSPDDGQTWRLVPRGPNADGLFAGETAFLEVSPGRVLAMTRAQTPDIDNRYLLQSWSEDGGLTWSHPLRTDIWGYPPHLLMLRDGRVLCSFGYRRQPMGVRAVLSRDGGETWDLDNVVVLRDDGGTPCKMSPNQRKPGDDLGYPISTQLPDGGILTVYYITLSDGVTHAAATRWEV